MDLKIFKISIFQFSILKFIDFKITTNSFKYSLVENFLKPIFSKVITGKGYTFGKSLTKFSGLYTPLPGVWGHIIRATDEFESKVMYKRIKGYYPEIIISFLSTYKAQNICLQRSICGMYLVPEIQAWLTSFFHSLKERNIKDSEIERIVEVSEEVLN